MHCRALLCERHSSLVIVVAQGGHEKQRKQNCNYHGDIQRTSGRRKIGVRQAQIEVLQTSGFQRAPTILDGELTAVPERPTSSLTIAPSKQNPAFAGGTIGLVCVTPKPHFLTRAEYPLREHSPSEG
jgi:hypothetical protein